MANREGDPLVGFTFRVDFGDLAATSFFTEVSGIGSEHEIAESKVVDTNGREVVLKVPGRLKWNDITLKRGITEKMDIWDWRKMCEDGDVVGARRNCSVFMMSRDLEDVAQWDLINAWPSKVSGPAIKSDSNEFGIEELTIVCEGFERIT
jgi:phage tail-like protein